jgi:enamine deaminase RidA (YjgF/YER057c/UK114 family)
MLNEVAKNTIIEQESYIIYPTSGITVEEQTNNCLNQISTILQTTDLKKWQVIKQVYFVSCKNNEENRYIEKIISNCSYSFFSCYVPTSVIPEAPLNGSLVALEITIMPLLEIGQIEIKEVNNIKYLVINSLNGKYIVGCGLGTILEKSDIQKQGNVAFDQMQQVLNNENISFGNVIRQWNYIKDIVGYTGEDQHYQIFNDIRSAYYKKATFKNGYPSATGIGMSHNGVIIDFIALVPVSDTNIIPIKSPVQADAHQYSENVLAQNTTSTAKKTTPKFERAKIVLNKNQGTIYVSGTAAIKGELSSDQFEIKQQTSLTIENIYQLVSNGNLTLQGINGSFVATPQYFRVYIKNRSDFKLVQDIVSKKLGKIPVLYVEADICRPELVVEIEGVFSLIGK